MSIIVSDISTEYKPIETTIKTGKELYTYIHKLINDAYEDIPEIELINMVTGNIINDDTIIFDHMKILIKGREFPVYVEDLGF